MRVYQFRHSPVINAELSRNSGQGYYARRHSQNSTTLPRQRPSVLLVVTDNSIAVAIEFPRPRLAIALY